MSISTNQRYLPNFMFGKLVAPQTERVLNKYDPNTEELLSSFPISGAEDLTTFLGDIRNAQRKWGKLTPIERHGVLKSCVMGLEASRDDLIELICLETGKRQRDAGGEFNAGVNQGWFWCGQLFSPKGWVQPSTSSQKLISTERVARGVAGLVVPANTAFANIMWKVCPAIALGNAVIVKSSEDSPALALEVAKIFYKAGLPAGILNVFHGDSSSGQALIDEGELDVFSFTGSSKTGSVIHKSFGGKLIPTSFELGGCNPFIVLDECDLNQAVQLGISSAFSNAGQRCSAASRFIVHADIYDLYRENFLKQMNELNLGVSDVSDLGPLLSEQQLLNVSKRLSNYTQSGGYEVHLSSCDLPDKGFYMVPALVEVSLENKWVVQEEIFGPIAFLYRAESISEIIELANNSDYGLTAAIQSASVEKGLSLAKELEVGVVNINGPTYGSEPHLPFGGFKKSGNGTREPGVQAVDIYSTLVTTTIFTPLGAL